MFDCPYLQNEWTNSHDFGTLRRFFVLNASVDFILNIFITQAGPFSERAPVYAIRLENPAKLL